MGGGLIQDPPRLDTFEPAHSFRFKRTSPRLQPHVTYQMPLLALSLLASGMEGDVMTYDVDSTIQSNNLRRQQEYAGRWGASSCEQMMPKAETLVGDWYFDEFGNQTREIKARD